jgi:hypothetical protein
MCNVALHVRHLDLAGRAPKLPERSKELRQPGRGNDLTDTGSGSILRAERHTETAHDPITPMMGVP